MLKLQTKTEMQTKCSKNMLTDKILSVVREGNGPKPLKSRTEGQAP